jgi:hypothetical protein
LFQRIINVIKGWFGLQVSGLERNNPDALIELEKENLRRQISKFNEGLASHAALSEKLMTQIRRLEKEERTLRAKITAHLKANNRQHAGQYALRHQEVKRASTRTGCSSRTPRRRTRTSRVHATSRSSPRRTRSRR